jgi:DUF3102 family protein
MVSKARPAITPAQIVEINAAHNQVVNAERGTLEFALKAGKLLKIAKDANKHGEWATWLNLRCPEISERIASSYMRLAANEEKIKTAAQANRKRVSDLSIRETQRLIAPEKTETQIAEAKKKVEARKEAKKAGASADLTELIQGDPSPDVIAKSILVAGLEPADVAEIARGLEHNVDDEDRLASLLETLETDDVLAALQKANWSAEDLDELAQAVMEAAARKREEPPLLASETKDGETKTKRPPNV